MRICRKADPKDFAEILNLNDLIPATAAFNWPRAKLQEELLAVQSLVCLNEEKIVSFLSYRELTDIAEISVLATHPDYLRMGLQSCLVKYLQELAAEQQKSIFLEVHAGNQPARSLYEKLGFLETRSRLNYYSDGGVALVLAWKNKAGCES